MCYLCNSVWAGLNHYITRVRELLTEQVLYELE